MLLDPENCSWLQHFPGFTNDEIHLLDDFYDKDRQPLAGFLTDFMGVRTRCTSLATAQRAECGKLINPPIPGDYHAEAIEYIGLIKSVRAAKNKFVAMELGAGWGPWLVAGLVAANRLDISDVRLVGVEADEQHFESMRQHFKDNGIDPESHRLFCCAVGKEKGKARWPKVEDSANQWGARPVLVNEGGTKDSQDVSYLGALEAQYIDVEVIGIRYLLELEPIWDLVHIDVQGWEFTLCDYALNTLNLRVRYIIVGTHSRKLDGDIYALFHGAGWILENEKPTQMSFHQHTPLLESMNIADGTQVWRNPRIT